MQNQCENRQCFAGVNQAIYNICHVPLYEPPVFKFTPPMHKVEDWIFFIEFIFVINWNIHVDLAFQSLLDATVEPLWSSMQQMQTRPP